MQQYKIFHGQNFQKWKILRNQSWIQYCRSYATKTKLPTKADAVVIGGGSVGCSTLYHLTKLGVKNAVLLERHKLTAGTTWHTSGLVWSLRPSDTDIQLLKITRDMLGRLEEETGVNPGFNMNGGLFLASTKERLDEYKRLHTIGNTFGIYSEILSPLETKQLFPLIDEKTLYGTMYAPTDGTVDPSGLCTALTKYAIKNGANVVEDCNVTNIRTSDSMFNTKTVKGVETSEGYIETPVVVNCTGAWSPKICKMVEIEIPLVPMKHSYVVFDKLEEVKGMPNIRDHDESIYFRIQGDSLSVGGYEMNPAMIEKVEGGAFGLYDLDWEMFNTHVSSAIKRIPRLGSIGIKSTICGPESFTPDHKPLLGEDRTVSGFFHGCGFNSAGMMFGGGAGDQLAKWIVNGRPDLHMFNYDIRRFSPKLCGNKQWAKERSHEAYAKNYSIVYKNDEPLAGRNQILSPFHSRLSAAGSMFQECQGWEIPGYFSPVHEPASIEVLPYDWYAQYEFESHPNNIYAQTLEQESTFEFPRSHDLIRKECEAVRKTCGVFDMSHFGKYFLIGPDATKAVQYLFTNDIHKPPGSVVYTCFLNKNGGTESDLTLAVINSEHSLVEDPDFLDLGYYLTVDGRNQTYTKAGIISALKSCRFDVDLVDKTEEFGILSIQGPKSRKVLRKLFPETNFRDSEEGFSISTHQILHFNHIAIRAIRFSYVGEMGWELHIPTAHCLPIYDALMNLGQEIGIKNAGWRAIESLSIEKGHPWWNYDIRADDTPIEAGMEYVCKLDTNEDFIGRKALLEQQSTGIRRRLVTFTLEETQKPLWGLEGIWDERYPQKPVGYLRRADYGFTIGKSIGHGYLEVTNGHGGEDWVKDIENGKYSIEVMGQRFPAKVHLSSVFDPKNLRVQGVYENEI